ncbi:MAG TPA: hypothetical protein VKN99_03110 [Polyangia bacterium]|nr:hypothetical protein [Polyangia bacterium]
MPRRTFWVAAGVVAGLCLGLLGRPAAAGGKYYIRIADTQEPPDLKSGLLDEAKKLLREELARRPEFVLELKDAPPDSDPDALAAELKKRNLKGYKVFVRLTHVGTEILPPRPGRRYRQVQATVRASIIGISIPSQVMALGGDGESSSATEFSGKPDDREVAQLKHDALADALSQAVDKALLKLAQGFMTPPSEKPRKKK